MVLDFISEYNTFTFLFLNPISALSRQEEEG